MDYDSIRTYCLSLKSAIEDIQWGNDLLFRIGGKIFAGMNLTPPHQLSFKCTPDLRDGVFQVNEEGEGGALMDRLRSGASEIDKKP